MTKPKTKEDTAYFVKNNLQHDDWCQIIIIFVSIYPAL